MQAPGADSEESASEVSTSRAASSNNPTARSTGPTARLEAVAESENLLASHEDGGITRLDSEAPRTWRLVEDNDATEELEGETDASVHGPGDPPPWGSVVAEVDESVFGAISAETNADAMASSWSSSEARLNNSTFLATTGGGGAHCETANSFAGIESTSIGNRPSSSNHSRHVNFSDPNSPPGRGREIEPLALNDRDVGNIRKRKKANESGSETTGNRASTRSGQIAKNVTTNLN